MYETMQVIHIAYWGAMNKCLEKKNKILQVVCCVYCCYTLAIFQDTVVLNHWITGKVYYYFQMGVLIYQFILATSLKGFETALPIHTNSKIKVDGQLKRIENSAETIKAKD